VAAVRTDRDVHEALAKALRRRLPGPS